MSSSEANSTAAPARAVRTEADRLAAPAAAQQALGETEERYRLAARATNDAVWDWDFATNHVLWNEALETAYGHAPADVEPTGEWWIAHIHPDDLARVHRSIHTAIDGTADSWTDEYRFLRADGAWAEVLDRGHITRDADGRATRMIGAMLDLTERRRTEAALRESEERLRLAVENAEVGFWDVDVIHDRLIWPARTKAMFGISPDVPVTMQDFYDGLHPDDRATTSAAFAAASDPERRALYDVEYRTIGKEDGVVRRVSAKGRGLFDEAGQCVRLLGTALDVTERGRAQSALRASEARYRDLFEAIDAGFCVIEMKFDAEGRPVDYRFVEVNPAFEAQTGLRDAVGTWMREIAPAHEQRWFDIYGGIALTGEPVRFELAAAALDDRWYDVHAFRTGKAKDRRVAVLFNDITPRRRSELAMQTLNETLEQQVSERTAERDRMWRMSPDLLAVLGFDGVFRRVNPAWGTVLGYAADELVGTRVDRLVHPDDVALTEEALVQASEGALPAIENRYRHKDGGYRWISWITPPPVDGLIYATGRHVTADKERQAELEAAQEALRQSQKMEAVGQLTGGIAHDFNNMLAVVIGSLDLLGRRIGSADPRAKRYVDAAMDGARRAATLTQRLLAFSRQQPLKPEPVDANKLVAGMSDLLRHSLGGDARLETVLAGGLWRAHADPNQLENAILNLAINARDAMAQGGRVTIETANCHLDARYAAAHLGVPAGQYVMIAVSDTGSGMPPEVIAKAFDPFFTTKQVGKGTGLGLSQVYGFVKQSGGHVKIYSEPGQGTTIKVYLPRLIGGGAETGDDAAGADMPLGESQEVVLVVEDEPAVRQFSVDALTELGYQVLEADGAAAALRLLDVHPEIALMFSDVVMPEINGAKLAEEARRRRPDLRVLFTTGYTRNAVVHNGVLDPGVELIGKPFTIEELAAKVRQILDAPV